MDGLRRSRDEALMARYLLGELSATERERVEERFFRDSKFLEQLLAVEDELVDDYARGTLTANQRHQFERHWLVSPERRERVEMATQLIRIFRERPSANRSLRVPAPPGRPVSMRWRWSLAAAGVIIAVGALWLVPQAIRARSELVQIRRDRVGLQRERQQLQRQLEDERARNNALTEQLRESREASRSHTTAQAVVAFVLPPGLTRSDTGQRRLLVPAGIAAVRLQVDVPADVQYRRYRALLQTPEADNVWSQDLSPPAAAETRVFVTVPSSALLDGDYILTLQGLLPTGEMEDVTSRTFRIVRR